MILASVLHSTKAILDMGEEPLPMVGMRNADGGMLMLPLIGPKESWGRVAAEVLRAHHATQAVLVMCGNIYRPDDPSGLPSPHCFVMFTDGTEVTTYACPYDSVGEQVTSRGEMTEQTDWVDLYHPLMDEVKEACRG